MRRERRLVAALPPCQEWVLVPGVEPWGDRSQVKGQNGEEAAARTGFETCMACCQGNPSPSWGAVAPLRGVVTSSLASSAASDGQDTLGSWGPSRGWES